MTDHAIALVVEPTDDNLRKAAAVVRDGGVIVAPSDTNLALTLDPWNPDSVLRAFAVKRRPPTSPLTLFVRRPADVAEYTTVSPELRPVVDDILNAFWPGPFNVVLPRSEVVPDFLVCGGDTVAVGCLSNPVIQRLLDFVGKPVAMTSANLSGMANDVLVDVSLAVDQIGDAVDLIVAGENMNTTMSSTILDASCSPFRVLRHGDVSTAAVRSVVAGRVPVVEARSTNPDPDSAAPSRPPPDRSTCG